MLEDTIVILPRLLGHVDNSRLEQLVEHLGAHRQTARARQTLHAERLQYAYGNRVRQTHSIGDGRIGTKDESCGSGCERCVAQHGEVLVILCDVGGQQLLGLAHDRQHPRPAVLVSVCCSCT